MSLIDQYTGFLESQPLWNSNDLFELIQFNTQELFETSTTDKVSEIIISENEVLGKRIERFFEHCINESIHYRIISKNIQVFKDKITIGELDFLLQDVSNKKLIHVELIYKFYVYDPNIKEELERWIGSNRKDSLLQKVQKLKTKQLPLLFKQETKSILENLELDRSVIQQEVCYLGHLFVPLSYINKKIPFLNNKCIVGYWIHLKDFTYDQYKDYLFHIPQKKDWVVNPKSCLNWSSYKTILKQLEMQLLQKKSPLLWSKSNEDSYARFFIVWW
ncbi:DUF1853 family protein [Aquimarina sp. 2201CG5-10]|uniref:DUF1853 family protein n=1 Tax=Aquimarina callyspongiae TaxID=3098150 RepID=UPI002AB3EE35|nr:DUF1853 family protein [Aquimarina sp. 2201CG5-10]MDY8137333.1 DUF1853 family protein [Aquimarina sp. 2201CG5-10]